MNYLNCETAEEKFGTNETPCNNGDIDMNWLVSANINYSNRAYQREKIASISWKQGILDTMLRTLFAGIPEVHIRVIEVSDGIFKYELIDGQQRITAIVDYLNGGYAMPKGMVVDGCDISGMFVKELRDTYPLIYDKIMNYRISCKWYEDITDTQTAYLFIHVLNNVNDMKPQEIRNAILGAYSTFVRDTARFSPHSVFTRISETKGNTTKEKLKYFSFALKGRMEVDEWLSELIYLWINGASKGISHQLHYAWVEKIQSPMGKYEKDFIDEDKVLKLLNFAESLLKSVDKTNKSKLTSMVSMMLVLYANDLKNRYGNLVPETFTNKFFETIDKYSDTSTLLYTKMSLNNGKPMGPMNELFGGKNSNSISTLFRVLNHEVEKLGLKEFGVIEIDKRDFKRADVIKRWKEQGGNCGYLGTPVEEDDIVGDHFIPRSAGVENGGVTEYDNLVVTSKYLNEKKSNMSPDAFQKLVEREKVKEVA